MNHWRNSPPWNTLQRRFLVAEQPQECGGCLEIIPLGEVYEERVEKRGKPVMRLCWNCSQNKEEDIEVRFWLHLPSRELGRHRLLDEHRSIHLYFGGMLREPKKWVRHKILGSLDPEVMYMRHEEIVAVLREKGYRHRTPLDPHRVQQVTEWRKQQGLKPGEYLSKNRDKLLNQELAEAQLEYIKRHTRKPEQE